MKQFLTLATLFAFPLIFCVVFIFVIDPYNFYNVSGIIDNATKFEVLNRSEESTPRGNMLWKAIEFKRQPSDNLLIGDSQGYHMKEELIKQLTGKNFYNFCIPAANTETKVSIFWFAAKQTKLNHVIIQLSFQNWQLNYKENLFHFAQDYLDNSSLYILNSYIFKDSFQNINYKFLHHYEDFVNENEFPITEYKNKRFDMSLKRKFSSYSYPSKYLEELQKIVIYCDKNHINLEFLILPCHQQYYDYLAKNDLIRFNEKFISDITSLTKTNNYSSDIKINSEERNFIDYLHLNQNTLDSITRLVWGNK